MRPLQIVALTLDIVLVAASIVAYRARPRIGGELAKGLRILLIGVIILGLAHFIETGLFVVFSLAFDVNEVLHRLIVATGSIFVILGFFTLRRVFEK